ncbi:MAG: hypothetical protein J7K75_07625 [Desulfuromonas sp.]|nr:hypothetical protein [Desulfuromonas sp.]
MAGQRSKWLWLLIVLLLPVYAQLHTGSWAQRAELRQSQSVGFLVPSQFSRVLACGYKGLLADYQFLRILTFFGDRSLNQQPPTAEDWDYFRDSIDVITDLDPWFYDPYVLTEGLLTWDAGRIEEANALLAKGVRYRTNDWRLPYYIGFNNFFFLKDHAAGAEYIMKAARLPGSPSYLPTLAARLAYYGGKSQTAVLFLKQMLAENSDERLARRLQLRLLALERAAQIEDALQCFRHDQQRDVVKLSELVSSGYLESLPEDPYGGRWGILKNGRVFSTSKFVEKKKTDVE